MTNTTYTVDYTEYGFGYDADYLIMMTVCPTNSSDPEECNRAEYETVEAKKNYLVYYIAGAILLLLLIVILIALVVCCCLSAGAPVRIWFKKEEGEGTVFKNPAYG